MDRRACCRARRTSALRWVERIIVLGEAIKELGELLGALGKLRDFVLTVHFDTGKNLSGE